MMPDEAEADRLREEAQLKYIYVDRRCQEKEEAKERQLAELEFVKAAYIADEAWSNEDETTGCLSVIRILQLPVKLLSSDNSSYDSVAIAINLEMPLGYPVIKGACLNITASLHSSPANPPFIRKAALNAIPPLVNTCQLSASEFAEEHDGGEAVWHVFTEAEEWIDSEWLNILQKQEKLSLAKTTSDPTSCNSVQHATILGRRCIYSHHIIANSKRKALASLASEYKLGGYVKIGWPGVIIVEGSEDSCQAFVDEIKTWRWQHLSIRVEEQKQLDSKDSIESSRQLPQTFFELGEDDMSVLARYCREAGLEHMFLSCLKIDGKNSGDAESISTTESPIQALQNQYLYAALVHIDHMNDRKGYHKWLKKESESSGCTLFIKHCLSPKSSTRPLIYVGVVGEKEGVKRVLKQWRISRVDVDSKSKPCLERMMTVLVEGEIQASRGVLEKVELMASRLKNNQDYDCSFEEIQQQITDIFGDKWAHVLRTGLSSN